MCNVGVWTGCRPWIPSGAFCTLHMTGSAPFGRTWCGKSCEHPHPSHHALSYACLQHPHVDESEKSAEYGVLHTDCTSLLMSSCTPSLHICNTGM